MSKAIVVYGSTTGTTEDIAGRIASKLGVDAINVTDLTEDVIAANDVLVLGSSTWGSGELQDDWYDGVNTLKAANLSGKKVALFACGDSSSYSDTFADAMGVIYNEISGSGATFIGQTSTDGYTFDSSASVIDGKFIGLAIDEVNEADKSDDRIAAWVSSLGI